MTKLFVYQLPSGVGVTYAGTDTPGILMWLMYGANPKPIYAVNVKPLEHRHGNRAEETPRLP